MEGSLPRSRIERAPPSGRAQPALTRLVASRAVAWVVASTAATLLALESIGVAAWSCPFERAISLPCPGCGLGRSVVAGVTGDWSRMLTMHAFGPLALAFLTVVALAAVLPGRWRSGLLHALTRFERTGLPSVLLALLLVYWIVRVLVLDAPYPLFTT